MSEIELFKHNPPTGNSFSADSANLQPPCSFAHIFSSGEFHDLLQKPLRNPAACCKYPIPIRVFSRLLFRNLPQAALKPVTDVPAIRFSSPWRPLLEPCWGYSEGLYIPHLNTRSGYSGNRLQKPQNKLRGPKHVAWIPGNYVWVVKMGFKKKNCENLLERVKN